MQETPSNRRAEPAIDPSAIQTRTEFATALELLHDRSGLTFREVSRDITLSAQAVHGYVRGKHLPQARGKNGMLFVELLRTGYGITDQDALGAWTAALRRVAVAPGPRRVDEATPYPGLRPFRENEREWFFGRDDLIASALDTLTAAIAADERSMLVVGPSGAGKSSLVNVGILAAAKEREPLRDWRTERITPGADPVDALTAVLEAHAAGPCLLVIDQMEELWADSVTAAERAEFLSRLRLSRERTPPVFTVLVVRADFYGQVLGERFLADIAAERQVNIVPMEKDQLKAAIEQPARKVHVEVESALTTLLLRDLDGADVGAVGALPLLALALHELWRRGQRHTMAEEDYTASGGLAHIINRTAEAAFGRLTEPQQRAAREVFTRMVSVQEGLPLTRRRRSLDELTLFRSSYPELDAAVERFTAARLLVHDEDGVTFAHEAILRAWPRLQRWIEADRRRLAAHGQLAASAGEWTDNGHDHAFLYPQPRLDAIEEALGPDPMLTASERSFLSASRSRAVRFRRVRSGVSAAVLVLVLALAASLVTAVNLHSQAVRQAEAAEAAQRLTESRMIATQAEQLRQFDPALAAQFAVAAYRTSPTLEARSALLSATATPPVTRMPGTVPGTVERMDVNAEGSLLAAAVDTGDVLVWDITEPFAPSLLASALPGVEDVTGTLRFADDGRLYSGGADGVIHVHDFSDPEAPRLVATAEGPSGGIDAIAVHRPGGALAAGGPGGDLWLWEGPDLSGEPVRLEGPGGPVAGLAFSPDGSRLAAASYDGLVALYELDGLTAETEPAILDEGYERFLAVAFSSDGSRLAAGTSAGPVVMWDLEDGIELLAELEGPAAGWSDSVAFLPGTPYLAAAASDGLWLWNYESGAAPSRLPSNGPVEEVRVDPRGGAVFAGYDDGGVKRWQLPGTVLNAPTDVVYNLHFLADGSTLASADGSGSIWLWDTGVHGEVTAPVRELRAPEPSAALIGTVSGNRDGTLLAASGIDGTVWVWDLTDPQAPPLALTGPKTWAGQIAFSPADDRIAAAVNDGTVVVWDLGSASEPLVHRTVSSGPLGAIAFSPDGALLIASGFDHVVHVWDATDADALMELGPPLEGPAQTVQHLAFSDDGSLIAAASEDGRAYLWGTADLAASPEPTVLTGNGARVSTVDFSPDGRYLAGASYDGVAIVWSLADRSAPERHAVLTGSAAGLVTVAFNHDGTVLAGAGDDPAARLWRIDPEAAAAAICEAAGAGITEEEWRREVPGVAYRAPC